MYTLRDYQQEAIDSFGKWVGESTENPLLVLPTGAGKSIICAEIARQATVEHGGRVLVLTHVKELIEQNYTKLCQIWPEAPATVFSASLKQKRLDGHVVFAGIQSLANVDPLPLFDLVIVDEAHRIPPKGDGQYRTVIDRLRATNPGLQVLGLTATPYRTSTGLLYEGEGALFGGVAYDVPLSRLVSEGYLSPLKSKGASRKINLAGVRTRGGEFVTDEVEERAAKVIDSAIDEIVEYGYDRRSWLIFSPTVRYSHELAEKLVDFGINAEVVTGATPAQERDDIIERYRSGELQCLINVDVLTTGFDAPETDLLVLLRPTQSPGLYVQMVGRGMRIAEDKADCLVLDFAGNIERHGPVDSVTVTKRKKRGKTIITGAPTKECPDCNEIVGTRTVECPSCGYVWPVKHLGTSDDAPILGEEPIWVPVTGLSFARHVGGSGIPSVRVNYVCGLSTHSEWLCVEHVGFPRRKAEQWFRRALSENAPNNATEAVELLRADDPQVEQIQIKMEGKYVRILDYKFAGDVPSAPDAAEPAPTPAEPRVGGEGLERLRRLQAG